MSVFEIEGVAKREVICDLVNIEITFRSMGVNSYEVSQKVLNQCDQFLEEIAKSGMNTEDIRYGEDNVDDVGYRENERMYAKRKIHIRIPFDMKTINFLQATLLKGKYDYVFDMDSDISNKAGIRIELAREALRNSRLEAEQLAEELGLSIKGVKTIRKNKWDDNMEIIERCEGAVDCLDPLPYMPSDKLGASTVEESVKLYVKWILE